MYKEREDKKWSSSMHSTTRWGVGKQPSDNGGLVFMEETISLRTFQVIGISKVLLSNQLPKTNQHLNFAFLTKRRRPNKQTPPTTQVYQWDLCQKSVEASHSPKYRHILCF